jgi:hypothetical protein
LEVCTVFREVHFIGKTPAAEFILSFVCTRPSGLCPFGAERAQVGFPERGRVCTEHKTFTVKSWNLEPVVSVHV